MATRREHGTGSIYRRASDGRWVGAIQAGWTTTGARRRITVSVACPCRGTCKGEGKCPGWREARRKLDRKRAEIEAHGAPAAGVSRHTTVKSWADYWLPLHVTNVRASTATTDAGTLRKWIIPTIGAKRLDTLAPHDIRAVHATITDAGLTTTTARHAHSVLTKMLKAALLDGHQVPMRVFEVKAPPVASNDRDAIPLEQAKAILRTIEDRPDRARWVAALLQGMRQGECLGLTWDAVDFAGGTLDITWQLDALPYADRAAGTFKIKPGMKVRHLQDAWHLTPVKTAKGQRIIPLVVWMADALMEWRKVAPASPHGLVWPRPDGRPQDEKEDRAAWARIQDEAGVRHPSGRHYTLHEARHATATLLLEAGVDPEVIKAILGHSSIVTSRGYMHVNQALARKALTDVAERLGLTATTTEP